MNAASYIIESVVDCVERLVKHRNNQGIIDVLESRTESVDGLLAQVQCRLGRPTHALGVISGMPISRSFGKIHSSKFRNFDSFA